MGDLADARRAEVRPAAGKTLPPLDGWGRRTATQIWLCLTWPRQVRQMKAAGFRRTGWMTWETGPAETPWDDPEHDVMADIREAMTSQVPPHPRGPALEFGAGPVYLGDLDSRSWREIGTTTPGSSFQFISGKLPDETLAFPKLPASVTVSLPMRPDPIADLARAARLASLYQGRRELHCAVDVATAVMGHATEDVYPPWAGHLGRLIGIDVIVEGDMPPGQWEIRKAADGSIVDSGKLGG
jgi:hypothetical protein